MADIVPPPPKVTTFVPAGTGKTAQKHTKASAPYPLVNESARDSTRKFLYEAMRPIVAGDEKTHAIPIGDIIESLETELKDMHVPASKEYREKGKQIMNKLKRFSYDSFLKYFKERENGKIKIGELLVYEIPKVSGLATPFGSVKAPQGKGIVPGSGMRPPEVPRPVIPIVKDEKKEDEPDPQKPQKQEVSKEMTQPPMNGVEEKKEIKETPEVKPKKEDSVIAGSQKEEVVKAETVAVAPPVEQIEGEIKKEREETKKIGEEIKKAEEETKKVEEETKKIEEETKKIEEETKKADDISPAKVEPPPVKPEANPPDAEQASKSEAKMREIIANVPFKPPPSDIPQATIREKLSQTQAQAATPIVPPPLPLTHTHPPQETPTKEPPKAPSPSPSPPLGLPVDKQTARASKAEIHSTDIYKKEKDLAEELLRYPDDLNGGALEGESAGHQHGAIGSHHEIDSLPGSALELEAQMKSRRGKGNEMLDAAQDAGKSRELIAPGYSGANIDNTPRTNVGPHHSATKSVVSVTTNYPDFNSLQSAYRKKRMELEDLKQKHTIVKNELNYYIVNAKHWEDQSKQLMKSLQDFQKELTTAKVKLVAAEQEKKQTHNELLKATQELASVKQEIAKSSSSKKRQDEEAKKLLDEYKSKIEKLRADLMFTNRELQKAKATTTLVVPEDQTPKLEAMNKTMLELSNKLDAANKEKEALKAQTVEADNKRKEMEENQRRNSEKYEELLSRYNDCAAKLEAANKNSKAYANIAEEVKVSKKDYLRVIESQNVLSVEPLSKPLVSNSLPNEETKSITGMPDLLTLESEWGKSKPSKLEQPSIPPSAQITNPPPVQPNPLIVNQSDAAALDDIFDFNNPKGASSGDTFNFDSLSSNPTSKASKVVKPEFPNQASLNASNELTPKKKAPANKEDQDDTTPSKDQASTPPIKRDFSNNSNETKFHFVQQPAPPAKKPTDEDVFADLFEGWNGKDGNIFDDIQKKNAKK